MLLIKGLHSSICRLGGEPSTGQPNWVLIDYMSHSRQFKGLHAIILSVILSVGKIYLRNLCHLPGKIWKWTLLVVMRSFSNLPLCPWQQTPVKDLETFGKMPLTCTKTGIYNNNNSKIFKFPLKHFHSIRSPRLRSPAVCDIWLVANTWSCMAGGSWPHICE